MTILHAGVDKLSQHRGPQNGWHPFGVLHPKNRTQAPFFSGWKQSKWAPCSRAVVASFRTPDESIDLDQKSASQNQESCAGLACGWVSRIHLQGEPNGGNPPTKKGGSNARSLRAFNSFGAGSLYNRYFSDAPKTN